MSCCDSSEDAPFPRDLENGETVNRGCTDKCCLVIFVLYLVGMFGEVIWAASQGVDPRRLTHGTDFAGRICGVDVPEQWVYWCGSSQRTGQYPTSIMHDSTVCVNSCPKDGSQRIPCLMPAFHNVTAYKNGYMHLPRGLVPVKTAMSVVVTQSIVWQLSYPTEPFAGKFCMPARSPDNFLRDEIINGPYAWRHRAGAAFGTVRRAAPLLIGIALLTVILGYFYLYMLSCCAGLCIFIVMLMSVLLLFSSGIFFMFAMFVSGEDEQSFYNLANPIFRTYVGWEAKWSSIIAGVVLVTLSSALWVVTCKTYAHIDEAVGIVAAACECLSQEGSLACLPLMQSATIIAMIVVLLMLGLPMVAALGHVDAADIAINGSNVDSLHEVFRRSFLDKVMVVYYIFGCWWITEFFLSFGQFVVSYATCLWYFQEAKEVDNDLPESMKGHMPVKHVRVRVAGVDDYYEPRDGFVTRFGKDKVLIAPVEDDYDGGVEMLDQVEYVKKPVACGVVRGACVGFWNHMGSLALGCLLIAVCRPFRMFSGCVTSFVRQQEGITHIDDEDEEEEPPDVPLCSFESFVTIGGYFGVFMDAIFGGFTKNTYTEIVLSASDFSVAAETSKDFVAEVGGSVAYLNGACFVYEVFGTIFLTLIGMVVFIVCATKVDVFANPASAWYIPNLFWGTVFATAIAGITAFEFMQVFNHSADALLYAFAWNRILSGSDEKFTPDKYCPGALRDMMQDYELEPGGPPKIESEYGPVDYIMRAGFAYPGWKGMLNNEIFASVNRARREITDTVSSASSRFSSGSLGSSSRSGYPMSSRYFKKRTYTLPIIDETPLMAPGEESARELSFR